MGTTRNFSGFKDTDTDTYASATWTANRAIESGADGKLAASSVTKAELGYVAGSTSNIQAQLNAKGTYTLPTLAANVVLVTNSAGGLANGGASVTELTYLAGATSNIQAQINALNPQPKLVEATMSANYTVSQPYADQAGANMVAITGLNVDVTTTAANTLLTISWQGHGSFAASTAEDIIFGYAVDDGTGVVCGYHAPTYTGPTTSFLGFTAHTVVATAGAHNVKVVAANARAAGPDLFGSVAGAAFANRLQVTGFGIS